MKTSFTMLAYPVILYPMKPVTFIAAMLIATICFGQDLSTITIDGKPCPPEGSAKSVKEKDLNKHKNRFHKPAKSDIVKSITLAKMLTPGDDTGRFTEDQAATVEGYVIDVSTGGCAKYQSSQGETCNCNTINKNICDTHIVIGSSLNAAPSETIIVEVTERLRMIMSKSNHDWSTNNIKATIQGKKVRFTGWLTFDTAHLDEALNTDPNDNKGKKNWRATAWEIHPVTKIEVVK